MAHSDSDQPASELAQRLRAAGCVFAEDEAAVLLASADSASELESLVRRREGGEPLEQIVGWVDFCGLRIRLVPGVFVPRQRSALVVREAVRLLNGVLASAQSDQPAPVVLDVCCGSGAIGAAVAAAMQQHDCVIELIATDIDGAAVECARMNVDPFHGQVLVSDMYAALPDSFRGRIDLIVANAPYVPTDEVAMMPREAREHEPTHALDGGMDGIELQRRVIAEASPWLSPHGRIVIETSARQMVATSALFAANNFSSTPVQSGETDSTVVAAHSNV